MIQEQKNEQYGDLAKPLSTQDTYAVQANLIKESGITPDDWVKQNANNFREIAKMHFFSAGQYENNPEEIEKFFKEKLREKGTLN